MAKAKSKSTTSAEAKLPGTGVTVELHAIGITVGARKPRRKPPAPKGESVKRLVAELYPSGCDNPYVATATAWKTISEKLEADSLGKKPKLPSYSTVNRALGRQK